jgi:hypothetical protein
MGGFIDIGKGGDDDWFVPRMVFEMLVERAKETLTAPDDLEVLDRAMAVQGLFLADMPSEQAARLGHSIVPAAEALARELRSEARNDFDLTFANALDKIPEFLSRFVPRDVSPL